MNTTTQSIGIDYLSSVKDQVLPTWVRGQETRDYFEKEWGHIPCTENRIFEQLCLLTFQLGLGFQTVLKKREALSVAFKGFEYLLVAEITDSEIDEMCRNSSIIRNRRKITACRDNARVLVEQEIILSRQFRQYFEGFPVLESFEQLPKTCPESVKLSKFLSEKEITFWGPTVICAAAQALGFIRVGKH